MRASAAWLRRRGKLEPAFVAASFPQQRAFMLDKAKDIAACCGRRSGKSMGLAGRLLISAEKNPGEMSLYIAQTKNNARQIVGRALMNMGRIYGLGLVMKEIDTRLHVIHPNGHQIWLAGAKHREAFEDFRGLKFTEVQIDEAQFHGAYLEEAVQEVLDNCRTDFDAAMVVSGTPSPLPVGFFHAVTTGLDRNRHGDKIPQWATHHWTMAENTFYRAGKGAKVREEARVKYGWSHDHPTFLREYWGQWVHDSEALVFPYEVPRNMFQYADGVQDPDVHTIPDAPLVKVLGIDLGYEDATAFVLLGYIPGSPKIYVLKAWKRRHMLAPEIAAHIESWRRQHKIARVVVDASPLKGYVEEFNTRYNLGVEAAQKQHKMAFAEMLRGDFMSGTIMFDPFETRDVLDELGVLTYNEDRDGFDENFADDAVHALIYAWRAARAYYRPEFEGPEPGSPEWLLKQVSDVKKEREKEILKKARNQRKGRA